MSDKFDFLKRLGAGNFGEVWLAQDRALAVQRAVKIIPPGRVANPQNLFQESQILKAAQHANIVRVEDAGFLEDGRVYVSMEYLPRGSLENEASGSFLPLRRAKQVMVDILRGLAHAHSRNIIHRDLKPANVLIGQNGEAKLSDFGLAIKSGAGIEAGTPKDYAYVAHLAPELIDSRQFKLVGDKFSPLTDIYSAGITLYRLVNGDAYFSKYPAPILVRMIKAGDFPDREAYRPFVPQSLVKIIDRALESKISSRFQDADEFRRALEKVDLRADWDRTSLQDGVRWLGTLDDRVFEVSMIERPDGWKIDVYKDCGSGQRAMRALCRKALDKNAARKHLRNILQRITIGSTR
jgi:serine/threonine protein kinase